MKTLTLKEAYAKAAPAPLRVTEEAGDKVGKYPDRCRRWIMDSSTRKAMFIAEAWIFADDQNVHEEVRHNAALLAHSFNVFPEVVEAINDALWLIESSTTRQWNKGNEAACRERLKGALIKSNTVQIP